jgi:hypothetical protein
VGGQPLTLPLTGIVQATQACHDSYGRTLLFYRIIARARTHARTPPRPSRSPRSDRISVDIPCEYTTRLIRKTKEPPPSRARKEAAAVTHFSPSPLSAADDDYSLLYGAAAAPPSLSARPRRSEVTRTHARAPSRAISLSPSTETSGGISLDRSRD